MTMLMKAGTLEMISGENKFLSGLGMGAVSKSQMSKFKTALNNLTASEKSFSGQFTQNVFSKSHKIELNDIAGGNEQINFLNNKDESEEELDIETGLLEGLMQQFVRHSLETGGPIAFEVGSESQGKISVRFEPASKKLSIESEISKELVANTGFMNIFSDLDIESIEFVDSKKLFSPEYSSINLNGKAAKPGSSSLLASKGKVNSFSEVKDEVKPNSFSFKKMIPKNTAYEKNSIVKKTSLVEEQSFLGKTVHPGRANLSEDVLLKVKASFSEQSGLTEKFNLLEKTNLSKKSTLSGKTDVASLTGKSAISGKTAHIEKNPKLVNVAAKTSLKQKEFTDVIVSTIKLDDAEKPKISQSQAVEAIKNTVTQSKSVFSGKSIGKFQVTMEVAEKGVLTVSSQKNENAIETNIQVETQSAKDWLKSALAKKGITVDNISVQAKWDSPKIKNEVLEKIAANESVEQRLGKIPTVEKLSASGKQSIDTEKTSFAFSKVPDMIRSVLKKIAAAGDYEIPAKEKEALSANLEKLEAKINQSILNGGKVEHTVKAGSDQAVKWLEKELRPIADEIVKQELPVSKLTVVKEESVKPSLKSEMAVMNLEPPDTKPIGKDAKQKTALSSINLINADKTSGDEDSFSGESQFSKKDFQVKESLTFKEVQGTESKILFESRGDGSQVVNISTATGPVQFNVVNGKLASGQRLDSSHMPEMIQKIAELAHNQANLSSHKLEVQMDIKDVGKVMVDALRHADTINLKIQVESSEARRILETQLRPFIEQMAKDGIDIGKLDVSVRDEKQERQMAQNFSESATQDREEKRASGNYRDFFSGFESETEIRQDFERKQVRSKVTGNQTLEIWA